MTGELKYVIFNTAMGWVGVSGSARGVRRTILPQRSSQKVLQQLGDDAAPGARAPHPFAGLIQNFRDYFNGHRVVFTEQIDWCGATTLQRAVWRATSLIPYGETRSYAWVASQIRRPGAARAAGQALARNPLPIIIPCHRVIASSGQLGGYSGGVEMKKRLLHLEASG